MEALKITNTHWLPTLAQRIEEYVKRVNILGIYGSSLTTYFHSVIQFGAEQNEFWVVFDDENPVAFGCFSVLGVPYIGSVLFEHAYSWADSKEAFSLLLEEFKNFGIKHKATVWHAQCRNETLLKYFLKVGKRIGLDVNEGRQFNITGKRVKNE